MNFKEYPSYPDADRTTVFENDALQSIKNAWKGKQMNLLTKSYDLVLKHRSELWIAINESSSLTELKKLIAKQKDEWDEVQKKWFQNR